MVASAWEDLPPEIIEAILHRLPAKSVGRFKSVSKTWLSLISEPTFIKTHSSFPQTTKVIIDSTIDGFRYSVDMKQLLPYLNNSDDDDIFVTAVSPFSWVGLLGSCNGLVLTKSFDRYCTMLLINPTTKEQQKVPASPFQHNTTSERCGFGYDSITDDYKVVWISYPNHNSTETQETYVSLYSLRNNSWKKLPNPPRVIIEEFDVAVVNFNCHWLVSSTTKVIVFSFTDEVFSEIKLPNVFLDPYYSRVVEIGGKLGVWNGRELCVMREYGNSKSWTTVFCHKFTFPAWPVSSVEESNGHIMLEDTIWKKLVVCSIGERRFRNVRIVDCSYELSYVGTFVESIESSKRIITTH